MIKQTRLYKWMRSLGFSSYDDFYDASIQKIDWFWKVAEQAVGIQWETPYDKVLNDHRHFMWPQWFQGAKLNIVQSAVEKWALREDTKNQPAIIWENEAGEKQEVTFADLHDQVNRLASGLIKEGLKKGDIAILYMPMLPETVMTMLAFAKIGVIFSPVFSGYGSEALSVRLRASGARILVTCDVMKRRGTTIDMRAEAQQALNKITSIEKVIVHSPTEATYEGDILFHSLLKEKPSTQTTYLTSEEPLMLLYTSGTTGIPKGAVHTHAGFPIKAAFDAGLCMDVKQGDRLFWLTDMGWMMGPFLVFGGLINGATIVLYDGAPDYPSKNRIWTFISDHQVTHFGLSPSFVRSAMRHHQKEDAIDISHVKVIISTGEPWNDEPWNWLFETIGKKQIPILNYSGGTEVSGGILGSTLLRPIYPVHFNAAILGMDVAVYDEKGEEVRDTVGELVVEKPWVGMTRGFWQDPLRYEATYFKRFPQVWTHGDWAIHGRKEDFQITGRSDDVMNIAGKRVGPAEIESILVSHPLVHEAAVIGTTDDVKGEAIICFVVLKEKQPHLSESLLIQQLTGHVANKAGKALSPKEIHLTKALPKTRNGKIVRRLLKDAYENKPANDLSALENPAIYTDIAKMIEKNEAHKKDRK
ncbi:AMP-binding protein [Bacillus sp. NPDC077027]|uniref:AMP-binding protein n=1 Tax=Bacillus sp. NPDC077027 TaxID=3390548 RepID=UPI003D03A2CB